MEVGLQALDGYAGLKNTFVSMRIGDVQKQSRFSEARKYVFPDPGDARQWCGRIEVFKRVGTCTVNFENLQGNTQTVEVFCDGSDKLRLGVAVQATSAPAAAQKEKVGKAKARLDAATKYLQEHRLEEILADAMREVIHDKPEDPLTFLSSKIMSHKTNAPKDLAKPNVAQPTVAKQEAARPTVAIVSAAEGFKGYYVKNFQECAPASFQGLYGKFSGFKAWAARPKQAPLPKQVSDPKDFAAYYEVNFQVVAPVKFEGLYSKFSGYAKAPKPKPALAAGGGPKGSFTELPSVGTWIMKAPKPVAAIQNLDRPAGKAAFTELPSVGTWITKVPKPPACVAIAARSAPAAAPAKVPFAMTPSVGSWLAPKPVRAAPTAAAKASSGRDWNLKPSVATWLAAVPPELPPEESILAKSQEMLLSMSNKDLVCAFRTELAKKEQEIEELRRTLGK